MVDVRRRAASRIGLLVFSLALSCGRSDPGNPLPGPACPDPISAALDPEDWAPAPAAGNAKFEVTLYNRCAETIWPAWGRTGGLDQTGGDPAFYTPLARGARNVVTMYGGIVTQIGFWGRTRCSFDEQGNGSCETGDCGQFVCANQVNDFPRDVTVYDLGFGWRHDYNVPMQVVMQGCEAPVCRFDLDECPEEARTTGACGIAACTGAMCPSSSSTCCHELSNGCYHDGDIEITFCP